MDPPDPTLPGGAVTARRPGRGRAGSRLVRRARSLAGRWAVAHPEAVSRKELEASHARIADAEQRLRQLLEAAPDAMLVTDAGGIIQTANAQAARLFGYPREELVGSPVDRLVPAAVRARHAAHRDAFGAAPAARAMGAGQTLRARRKDGSECVVEVSLSPLQTSDGLLVTAAIRDVTERARDEAEQAALRRIATAVAEGQGAADIFGLVAEELANALGVDNGSVVRFEGDDTATLLGLYVDHQRVAAADPLPLDGTTAVSLVARTGRAARLDAYRADPGELPPIISDLGLRSAVAAPIRIGGRLWGAVGAATTDAAPLPPGYELRVERFAQLVATAISNAQAWETLARRAATDAQTGLPNYRTFHERLGAEVERARRHHRQLSVVIFDLDRFKAVNDTYGHHCGDRVLAEVARRLGAEAREGEIVARVGGEEFAWLLPETDAAGAVRAAERARHAVSARPFDDVGTLTVSAGVCSLEDSGDAARLLSFADRALYWAKDAGRDATVCYSAAGEAVAAGRSPADERFQSMSSIRALARAIDAKDLDTRSHSERVALLAERLALRAGWTRKRAEQLHAAALLHDVGKIGVPDLILLKPGPLTDAEYEEVKRHAQLGAQIVAEVLEEEPTRWVRHHHERWDGAGYPDGLAGDAIPDGAQLLALADAWDVMTTNRSYKRTLSTDDARSECRRQAGAQFAPDAVEALLALDAADLDPPAPRYGDSVVRPPADGAGYGCPPAGGLGTCADDPAPPLKGPR